MKNKSTHDLKPVKLGQGTGYKPQDISRLICHQFLSVHSLCPSFLLADVFYFNFNFNF